MDDATKGSQLLVLLIHALVVLFTTAAFIGVAWFVAWQVLRRQRTVRELLGLDADPAAASKPAPPHQQASVSHPHSS